MATTTVPTAAAVPLPTPGTISVPTVGTTLATTTGTPTTPLIVFTGGATSSGFSVGPDENFAAQTMALLAPARYDAVNLSHRTEVLIGDLNTYAFVEIDPLYAASRSKNIVVLFAGSNDLAYGASGAEAFARLVTFCQARRSVGFQVVISTLLPRTGLLFKVTANDYESERQGYNASLRKNAASFADALADVGADPTIGAVGATANAAYYQSYGPPQPTPKGHRIIAGYVQKAILTL